MTRAERIRAIQDEYEQETGERPSRATAAVLLDRIADAEYERRAGGAYDEPIEPPTFPELAPVELDADAAYERHLENQGADAP